jgi:hypothetical protein
MSDGHPTLADVERNAERRRGDWRARGLLDMAEKARLQPRLLRRGIVFSLVKTLLGWRDPVTGTQPCTVSMLFEKAYGDAGAEYWRDWIDALDPDPNVTIAERLAAHVGGEGEASGDAVGSFEWSLKETLRATRVKRIIKTLAAIKRGSERERLEAMARDPNCEDLIPPSLRRFLTPIAPAIVASAPSSPKHPGGVASKFDWGPVERELEAECRLQESVPHRKHSDKNWRTKADAYRWTRENVKQLNRNDGGPCDTAMKDNVGPMLDRIAGRLKEGGN